MISPVSSDLRGIVLILCAGACYLAAAIGRGPLLESIVDVRAFGAMAFVEGHALRLQLFSFAMLLPTILLLCVEALRSRSLLRHSFNLQGRWFLLGFVAALLMSVALNAVNLWPFGWRWASNSTGAYAELLLHSHQGLAIALWALTSTAIVPILEEAIFRVGLLRGLCRWTRSTRFGILASSLLFGAAHLGSPFWHPDPAHLVNAFWIFLGSAVIATTTVRGAGNVSVALGSHIARNTIEFTLLLFAVRN